MRALHHENAQMPMHEVFVQHFRSPRRGGELAICIAKTGPLRACQSVKEQQESLRFWYNRRNGGVLYERMAKRRAENSAEAAHSKRNAEQMKRDRRYTRRTSGRSIWIWLNRYEKLSVRKKFMRSARKRLNGSLQMQRRNTQCVIHITGAWLPSHDGSGLNLLP